MSQIHKFCNIGNQMGGRWMSIIGIYIGKNQNPKNLGILLYRLHCQKNP